MVHGARAKMRQAKQELIRIDPVGVARTDAAYASVDLVFWPKDGQPNDRGVVMAGVGWGGILAVVVAAAVLVTVVVRMR